MTTFKAFFCRRDGLKETTFSTSYLLSASTLEDAKDEALALPRPPEANLIKIQDEDRHLVVERVGLADA